MPTVSAAWGIDKFNFTQAGAGAVKRLGSAKFAERISVCDYGATGDGVTNDLPFIQAAIDANPGKSIFFPAGSYKITGPILVSTDNTYLVGAGHNCTYIKNTHASGDAIKFYCTSTATKTTFINNVGLSGLYIMRNTAATVGASVRITRVNGGVFQDFISSDCPEGIIVEGGQMNSISRVKMFASGATFDLSSTANSALISFRETPSDDGNYQHCFTSTLTDFKMTSSKKTDTLISIGNCDGLQISSAYMASGYNSLVRLQGLRDGGNIAALSFHNIYFDAVNTGTGTNYIMEVPTNAHTSHVIYDVNFTGCIFGNTKSTCFLIRKPIARLSTVGCHFINTNSWAIDFEGDATTSHAIVSGCHFNNIGTLGGGKGTARFKDLVNLSFSGNVITNDLGVGYTLSLTGSFNVASVTGNSVKGNTADLSTSGATFTNGLVLAGNDSSSANTSSWKGLRFSNLAVTDTKTMDWYEEYSGDCGITFGGLSTGVNASVHLMRATRWGTGFHSSTLLL